MSTSRGRSHKTINCLTWGRKNGLKIDCQTEPHQWSHFVYNQRPLLNGKAFCKLITVIILSKSFGLLHLASVCSHAFLSNHVMTWWCSSKLLNQTESRALQLCSTGSFPACNAQAVLIAILLRLSLDVQTHLRIQGWYHIVLSFLPLGIVQTPSEQGTWVIDPSSLVSALLKTALSLVTNSVVGNN